MKGKVIQAKYHILKTLSQDAFSETFLAKNRRRVSRDRYIIKKFRPILGNPQGASVRHLFYQEASVLQRLSGSNRQIPRLYEYFMDGEDFYLVREWIKGLTLEQKVRQQGKLPEAEVEQILESILACLKYIHSHGIVYRQLAPSSIILRQKNWKDRLRKSHLPVPIYFGGVKELETKKLETQTNHFARCSLVLANRGEYIAPEQEQGKSVYASDLYSLGLTAIFLLTAKTPAELPTAPRTQKLLWHQERPELKIHLVRVLDRAICPDIQERFANAEAMLKALHSTPVSLSLPATKEPRKRLARISEAQILLALSVVGTGALAITLALLNIDFPQAADKDFIESARAYKAEEIAKSLEPVPNEPLNHNQATNTPTIPAFALGNTRQQITNFLGEPTMESPGYWQNSRALLYEDVVPNKITLGYLTDIDTTNVRQAEISFAGSVDLPTIQQAAKQLLQDKYSVEIEHKINQIYSKTSNLQEFQLNNLRGVVQRNPQNHIYLAIWDEEFH